MPSRWLFVWVLVLGVACQAPVPPATPTISPTSIPTSAPKPVASPSSPSSPSTTPAAAGPSPVAKPSAQAASPAPPVGSSRVDVLNAANAAFQRGNMTDAAQLYERVVNTPTSPGETAATQTAIDDFAHFRAMVALLATGDEEQAKEHLDALQSRDQQAPLTRLASQVWDQYGMTAQIKSACAQAQPQVAQAAPVLTALQAVGVTVDPATLCSVTAP